MADVRLFRAVSFHELADIGSFGGFRPIASSIGGKWFAEVHEHAAEWGRKFFLQGGSPFHLVQVGLPQQVADRMFRLPNLDQISPARYAEGDLLELINQGIPGSLKFL